MKKSGDYLNQLSTYARFRRFAREYLAERLGRENNIEYEEETISGRRYAVLRLKDAIEFMTKKDYTGNWYSELNEEFAFWDFGQHKQALTQAGFKIIENPNEPHLGSREYTNPWIVANRWQGKVALYTLKDSSLKPMEYPVTNVVLVAEKPKN